MENITIGDIVSTITIITAIAVFCTSIYKIYKNQILDKFKKQDDEITQLKIDVEKLKEDNEINKKESKLLLKSIQACPEGLKEQGCNGSVTTAIEEIDKYLLEASH